MFFDSMVSIIVDDLIDVQNNGYKIISLIQDATKHVIEMEVIININLKLMKLSLMKDTVDFTNALSLKIIIVILIDCFLKEKILTLVWKSIK